MSRFHKLVGICIATTIALTLAGPITQSAPATQRPSQRLVVATEVTTKVVPKVSALKPVEKRTTKPSRSGRTPVKTWSHPTLAAIWAEYPSWVRSFGHCVAKHESWDWPAYTNGRESIWQARNVHGGTSSGAFQMIRSTWQVMAQRAGVGMKYRDARLAPAHVQVRVFAVNVYEFGAAGAWLGTGCGYGT